MKYIGCHQCGLVLEAADGNDGPATQPCPRCSATMRPVSPQEARLLSAKEGGPPPIRPREPAA